MSEVIQYTVGMSNGFFIRNGKTVVAVDSGGEPGKDVFLKVCSDNNVVPRDIRLLIVTHGHVDHFVNIGPMKELTGAPILCHKEAARFLRGGLSPQVFGRNQAGRDIMEAQKKTGEITEDDLKTVEKDIQHLTDEYVGIVDKDIENKEKELLEV
jgi:glyoxylase-like metal-dependent hydrolase (beta-lactamase superfamily II)